jgi:hypothetical protein
MIVQELGQLLAQALVALALMAEQNGAFEQCLLQLLRQVTPQLRGRGAEREKITGGIFVGTWRRHRWWHWLDLSRGMHFKRTGPQQPGQLDV